MFTPFLKPSMARVISKLLFTAACRTHPTRSVPQPGSLPSLSRFPSARMEHSRPSLFAALLQGLQHRTHHMTLPNTVSRSCYFVSRGLSVSQLLLFNWDLRHLLESKFPQRPWLVNLFFLHHEHTRESPSLLGDK